MEPILLQRNFDNVYISSPAGSLPVTLSEVQAHCHANVGDEDDWFTAAIYAAVNYCQNTCRKALITQTVVASYNNFSDHIELPYGPVQSVSSIKTYDIYDTETDNDLTDFYIDTNNNPASIHTDTGFSWQSLPGREVDCLKVTYVAGYGDTESSIPKDIKAAIKLYVGWMYDNRAGEDKELPRVINTLLISDRRTWL